MQDKTANKSEQEYGKKVKVEQLLKTDETVTGQKLQWPQYEHSEISILKITIPVGEFTTWHLHTMPMFAYIVQGTLEIELEDGKTATYNANQA